MDKAAEREKLAAFLADAKRCIVRGRWSFARRAAGKGADSIGLCESDALEIISGWTVESCGHVKTEALHGSPGLVVRIFGPRIAIPHEGQVRLYIKLFLDEDGCLVVLSFHRWGDRPSPAHSPS